MNPTDFGKYRLQEKIGQGGMAEVFYAHIVGREGFTKEVALKRVLPHLCEDADFVKSFVDEARLGGLLNHHHIVQTLDFGQEQGIYYLAMEYVHGLTLREVINYHNKQRSPIPPSIVLDLILQFCDGLRYAHNAEDELGNPLNMVHRDLKPTNILVSSHGVVKIADFGIARAETNLRRTTYDGVLKGTAQYMSPEQALGDLSIDRRSDIFSVGSIAYEMISLRSLFYDPTNSIKTLRNVQDANVGDALSALLRDFPYTQRLVPLLEWMLQRDRSRRPGGVEEVLPELRRIHASLSRQLDMQGWAEQILVALGRPVRSRRSTTQTMRTIPASALGAPPSPPPPAPPPTVPLAPSGPPAAAARPIAQAPSHANLPPGFVAGRPGAGAPEISGNRPQGGARVQEPSGGHSAARPGTGVLAAESLLGPSPGLPGAPTAAALTTATLADVPIRPASPPARLAGFSPQTRPSSLPPPTLLPPTDDERTSMGLELDEDESEGARATVSITEEELRQAQHVAARGTQPPGQVKAPGGSPSQPFQLQMPPPLPQPKPASQGFALPPPQTSAADDWSDLRTTALEVPKTGPGGVLQPVGATPPPERPMLERKVQLTGPPAGGALWPAAQAPALSSSGPAVPAAGATRTGSAPPVPSPAPIPRPGPPSVPAMPLTPHQSPAGGDWADIQTRAIDPASLPGGLGHGPGFVEVTQPDPFPPGSFGAGGWNAPPAAELPSSARALVKQVEDARAATAAALLGGGPAQGSSGPNSAHLKPQAPPGVMVAQVRPGPDAQRGWGSPELPSTTLMDLRQAPPPAPASPTASSTARENSQPGFVPSSNPPAMQQSVWGSAPPGPHASPGWPPPAAGVSGQTLGGPPAPQGPGHSNAFPGYAQGPQSMPPQSAWGPLPGMPQAVPNAPSGNAGPGAGMGLAQGQGYPTGQGQLPSVASGQSPQSGASSMQAPIVQSSPVEPAAKKLPWGVILSGLGLLVAIAIAIALLA